MGKSIAYAGIVISLFFAVESPAGEGLERLPTKVLTGTKGEEYTILPLELQSTVVVSVAGGRNDIAMEVSPDGHIRIMRVLGSLQCQIPVRGKSIGFQVMTGQRLVMWPISKLRFTLEEDKLVAEYTPPGWAVAIQVEYSGLTGVEISFDGKTGQLYTDQRADTLLGVDGQVMLVRSGQPARPAPAPTPVDRVATPKPAPKVPMVLPAPPSEDRRMACVPLPDALSTPDGWNPQPRWTTLPFLPVVLEPDRPIEVSP
jgi:hypothetical protein